jgi:hypothetical protein
MAEVGGRLPFIRAAQGRKTLPGPFGVAKSPDSPAHAATVIFLSTGGIENPQIKLGKVGRTVIPLICGSSQGQAGSQTAEPHRNLTMPTTG